MWNSPMRIQNYYYDTIKNSKPDYGLFIEGDNLVLKELNAYHFDTVESLNNRVHFYRTKYHLEVLNTDLSKAPLEYFLSLFVEHYDMNMNERKEEALNIIKEKYPEIAI